ncbi:MAG TPA: cupin domain-containing protein [Pyrinomonadaceae bacterium]|nr:cupin domain-containing protein [Pyrinomonadaceae bacterium]
MSSSETEGNSPPAEKRRVTIEEAMALLPTPEGKRFATVMERGDFLVEIYAPRGTDPQQPHTRDEAYIVHSGTGEFVSGESREPFGPGDFLFVPAGVPPPLRQLHRRPRRLGHLLR